MEIVGQKRLEKGNGIAAAGSFYGEGKRTNQESHIHNRIIFESLKDGSALTALS